MLPNRNGASEHDVGYEWHPTKECTEETLHCFAVKSNRDSFKMESKRIHTVDIFIHAFRYVEVSVNQSSYMSYRLNKAANEFSIRSYEIKKLSFLCKKNFFK